MRTSEKGIAFIAAHEGVVTRAYRDVAGHWTIGVGHTASAGAPTPMAGMTITREEAFRILAKDVAAFEKRVTTALPTVPQVAFDGAVSFDFNTGAVHRASWVRSYRGGDMTAARAGLMQWVNAGGRKVAGLVRRREAEARLIFNGDYGEVGAATTAPAANPAASNEPDAVVTYQRQLAALGFYPGAIDGIAGPLTKAAVFSYQRTHPDLVADGIVGPATRAQLERDMTAASAKLAGGTVAVATLIGGTAAATVADENGASLAGAAVIGGIALVAAVVLFVVIRNRIRRGTAARRSTGE